jgi:signal transduction histidine kinase
VNDHLLGLASKERESTLLLAIIEATAAGPGVEPLAAAVAQLIVAATATDVCFVHVLDDAGGSLTLAGATPPFDRQVGRVRLPLGTGVAGWVASAGRPAVITERKEADPRYVSIPALRGSDYTSMASVPMASDLAGMVGVLNVHTRERREFTDRDIRLLTTIGSLVAGAVHLARLHRQLAARERANERFAEQVMSAQETERSRLASDIHDGISQRLVSLAYHLDAAASTVHADPANAAGQLATARGLVDLTLDEARVAVAGLRPPVLEDLGLAGGLASLLRSVPDMEVEHELVDVRLAEHVELALYRIAQEALQNVVRHAGAEQVRVTFLVEDGMARVEVVDDGIGFHPSTPPPDPVQGGYGLISMAWRAELVGGRLVVRSRPGDGTSVAAIVPVP